MFKKKINNFEAYCGLDKNCGFLARCFGKACFPEGKTGTGYKILLSLKLLETSANRGFNASWSRLSHVFALCSVLAARKNLNDRMEFRIGGGKGRCLAVSRKIQ